MSLSMCDGSRQEDSKRCVGGIFSGKGGGGGVFWDRTLPWDLSQIHPCTPLPGFSGGYERRRE